MYLKTQISWDFYHSQQRITNTAYTEFGFLPLSLHHTHSIHLTAASGHWRSLTCGHFVIVGQLHIGHPSTCEKLTNASLICINKPRYSVGHICGPIWSWLRRWYLSLIGRDFARENAAVLGRAHSNVKKTTHWNIWENESSFLTIEAFYRQSFAIKPMRNVTASTTDHGLCESTSVRWN